MANKSVVVLGAGFGGLRAAMDIAEGLRRLKFSDTYDVVLIDRNDCHVYVPLLYKVAASGDPKFDLKCTYDITALVADLPIRFIAAEVTGMDMRNGDISFKRNGAAGVVEKMHADYLVIALGSETNFFGIPGMQEHALQLKTLESAVAIRTAIERAFEQGKDGGKEIKIIAGGAGPNGIELAAEIRQWANREQKQNPKLRVSVSIVEALPGVLNGLDPRAATIAVRRMTKLHIPIVLNAKISDVAANELSITGADGAIQKIPFDIFIWTGGVKTPDILTQAPIVKDQRNRPLAKSDMAMACIEGTPNLEIAPMIYGIGDSVCFISPKTGKPAPAVAHVAILEGRIAARNILEEIKHAELPGHAPRTESYIPGDYPYVVIAGEGWAVAKLGPFIFTGWFGWAFEQLVELYYLLSIMPFLRAWAAWRKM